MKNRELFILGVAGLLAAATIYIVKRRTGKGEDTPPKAAPQLKIDNPGDQSEFPTAPNNEIELG